ncbi:MAG TPA: fatty acyl-AMP ligase, partial [Thermoanaerobaculia bacterium]|nr:fatty acyl-AMP ligase [Thermoanaerobaculia bacterium]
MSAPRTLPDLLMARAAEVPDAWAYRFLAEDGSVADERTWGELGRRARAVAARLAGLEGERALLLLPPGLEFVDCFLGCLAAGVVAVPSYPPTSRRSVGRVTRLLADARPRVALSTAMVLDRLRRWGGTEAGSEAEAGGGAGDQSGAVEWLAVEEIDPGLADGWCRAELAPERLAFLQYTSGSTSAPKGVMVSHGNLWHNQEVIRRACDHGPDSVFVSWLPLYHDLGLIGNLLQNLYVGSRCVLMSPVTFLQRPAAWLEAVSRYGATTSGGPNFAYELCLRRVGEADRAALDLSSWQVAFNGAEPVQADTLRRFADGFAGAGLDPGALYPCYGLAEATLMVSGGRVRVTGVDGEALQRHEVRPASGAAARELVSCGPPLTGQEVVIAEPDSGAPCPVGTVGEIWVGGPSVAGGYWQRPEESRRAFGASLADGRGPFLRTGDLGFLDAAGELFVTGRLKDLIIVRGRNYYPHDLELTALASHADLRAGGGAAFTVEADGEERPVLVHELERHHGDDLEAVAAAARQAVAEEHELQLHDVVLIRTGTLPKTTSGKVQRRACRQLYLDGELVVVARSAVAAAGAAPAAET